MYKNLTQKQRLGLVIILLATVITLLTHNYLADRHYQVGLGLAIEDSICNINSSFNCDNVNTSVYSEFLGIPMAIWGLATLFYFMLLALLAAFGKRGTHYAPSVYYLSVFIALTSVVMGLISIFSLGQYCLFCITAYLLSFITLAAVCVTFGARSFSQIPSDVKNLFSQAKPVLLFLILIPLTAQGVHKGKATFYADERQKAMDLLKSEQQNAEADLIKLLVSDWQKNTAFDFNTEGSLHYGAKAQNAAFHIVEYADVLCPHCRHAGDAIKAFTDSKTDVSWSLLFFPLDGECNKYVNMKTGYRCQLTKTILCLKDHPKGWSINEWFFARQSQARSAETAQKIIDDMIASFGVDPSPLNVCVADVKVQNTIDSHVEQAKKNQVNGTPAIFVNGKKLERGQFIPVLDAVYQSVKSGKKP